MMKTAAKTATKAVAKKTTPATPVAVEAPQKGFFATLVANTAPLAVSKATKSGLYYGLFEGHPSEGGALLCEGQQGIILDHPRFVAVTATNSNPLPPDLEGLVLAGYCPLLKTWGYAPITRYQRVNPHVGNGKPTNGVFKTLQSQFRDARKEAGL